MPWFRCTVRRVFGLVEVSFETFSKSLRSLFEVSSILKDAMNRLQSYPPRSPADAVARGARVMRSQALLEMSSSATAAPRFLADGPPSGGRVECFPQVGSAFTTLFSGTTSGWYDEDAHWPHCKKSIEKARKGMKRLETS